ncbi:hypothetical protein DB32_008738 [Sandaracinus amylolyticus]|uniref:Uncharacterized protein n=1 Tax=Sandaracinus amylolyticus TaxID=927083 RepID=A0A0F6SI52_9BACT|nr:hypothetical protein DB32_008738 [Sandaracinus amylolyticus]
MVLHPDGHTTRAEPPGHAADAPHTASHAHEPSQNTPPEQLPTPEHVTEHAFEPHCTPNPQLLGPGQSIEQLDASAQAIGPQESVPRHCTVQGALPQVAPKKQLRSPSQSTSQLDAPAHWTLVMQPWRATQRTWQGMPVGQTIAASTSPTIRHVPPAQPSLQTAGQLVVASGRIAASGLNGTNASAVGASAGDVASSGVVASRDGVRASSAPPSRSSRALGSNPMRPQPGAAHAHNHMHQSARSRRRLPTALRGYPRPRRP